MARTTLGLALSGGGTRAAAFHLGVLVRLAIEDRLEDIAVVSTVSGGSLAIGLVFSSAKNRWPSSETFTKAILPRARTCLTESSLQRDVLWRTVLQPWSIFGSRGNLLAQAIESAWGISGSMKDLPACPTWFVNSTCFETGRNWRFSQRHIGDWKFGHNFDQIVPIATAIAASAAIPYMVGFVKLAVDQVHWFEINPATDDAIGPVEPMRNAVRLWDGGVYENLGVEAIFKPQRGFVDKGLDLLVASDASSFVKTRLGMATGIFTSEPPFLRTPRLFEIATEQTRALRSRMLIDTAIRNEAAASILRIGRSVKYIDNQARRTRPETSYSSFLEEEVVATLSTYPTNATKMSTEIFDKLIRHGFETANATLTAFQPKTFPIFIQWDEVKASLRLN